MTADEHYYDIREEFAAANRALGVTQWATSASAEDVTFTRQPSGEMSQQLTTNSHPVAVKDMQVATELGVELETWTTGRDVIEAGLAKLAGVRDREPGQRVATDLGCTAKPRRCEKETPR